MTTLSFPYHSIGLSFISLITKRVILFVHCIFNIILGILMTINRIRYHMFPRKKERTEGFSNRRWGRKMNNLFFHDFRLQFLSEFEPSLTKSFIWYGPYDMDHTAWSSHVPKIWSCPGKVGCVISRVIWSEFRIGQLTTLIRATHPIFLICLISAETCDFYHREHTVIRKSQCSGSVISYDPDYF